VKRLTLAVSLMLSAWTARAYDAQIGDTLMELRISPTEQGVSFGQFLTPRVPVSVVAAMSLAGGYGNTPVGSLSLRAGYEQHHQGSAIVPRAAVEMGMAFDDAQGLGSLFVLRGGVVWYAIRSVGLGVDLGLHRRVGLARVDAALSLLSRF
jgi:hypothetical protein